MTATEQVSAGGVQEVVLPQVRVEVDALEEGEASIRTAEKTTAIARCGAAPSP